MGWSLVYLAAGSFVIRIPWRLALPLALAGIWFLGGLVHMLDSWAWDPGRPGWQGRWGGAAMIMAFLGLLPVLAVVSGAVVGGGVVITIIASYALLSPVVSTCSGLGIGTGNVVGEFRPSWRGRSAMTGLALGVAQASISGTFAVLYFVVPWPPAEAPMSAYSFTLPGVQPEAPVAAFGALIVGWGVVLLGITVGAGLAGRWQTPPGRR